MDWDVATAATPHRPRRHLTELSGSSPVTRLQGLVNKEGFDGAVDGGGLWTTAPVAFGQERRAYAARLTTALGEAQEGQVQQA